MPHEFRTSRRVEFYETDMAGIVHFSNYFRYLEAAEHAFFRSLGLDMHTSNATGMSGWARVHASCDFLAPLRYQDEVEIHLRVVEKRAKSISYAAEMHRVGDEPERPLVARAQWTAVHVRKGADDAALKSVAIPADVDEKIQVAPGATTAGKDD